jgi:hypothetical protein
MVMGLDIFEAKSFGDVEAVISLYEYGDNLEVYGDNNGDECYRVLLTLEDEPRLYNLLRDRNDARVMAEIEAAEFPYYLTSNEAWTVLRSVRPNDDDGDIEGGVAIDCSRDNCFVYDGGQLAEEFHELSNDHSWIFLNCSYDLENLLGFNCDRWTPPVPVVEEEPIASVNQSEVAAIFAKLINDASKKDLEFVVGMLNEVIAARGGSTNA